MDPVLNKEPQFRVAVAKAFLVVMLGVLDGLCTHYAVANRYGLEINPVMQWAISEGWSFFYFFKIILTLAAAFLMLRHYKRRASNIGLNVVIAVYGFLAVYHLLMIFILIPFYVLGA